MPVTNFPDGFTNGVTLRGLPITIAHPGKVFFVNNSSILAPGGIGGSDLGPGSYQRPFKTLNGAINNAKVVANRGDILMIMPGHAETISSSTAMTLATSGVCIVGLGSGALRPTFTLGTATTSTINVTASNISIINCLFIANYASVAALFTLTTAKDFALSECEFRDSSSSLNFVNIVKCSSTSNNNDGLYLDRCNFLGLGAASNTTVINALGTAARWTIQGCYIDHKATTAGGLMQIASGKNILDLIVQDNKCYFVGATTASMAVLILATSTASTGVIARNYVKSLCDTTPVMVTASSGLQFDLNYYSSNADKSGFLLPAVDS